MNARFACGSMVRFLACSGQFGSVSQIVLNKNEIFRPAGGEIPRRVRDRVTRVINRSYAVRLQTGQLPR